MSNNRKLLAVLAHPDDESFGLGATLAKYASEGVEVHLACATRGESGSMAAQFLEGFGSAAARRTSELECAAKALGIHTVHYFDYRDSGMEGWEDNNHPRALIRQPLNEVADKVRAVMDLVHPDVILTHDPMGGYRHPDHIHLHKAVVGIYADDDFLAANPPGLYYHLIPRKLLKLMVKVLPLTGKDPRRFGENKDIDLEMIASPDYPVDVRVNVRAWLGKREEASACHASQGGASLTGGGIGGRLRRLFYVYDEFMRGWPQKTGSVSDSLFSD